MTLQIGWKLQPCFAPTSGEDGNSSPATNEDENNAATNSSPTPAIRIIDSNGPNDSTDSDNTLQVTTDTSSRTQTLEHPPTSPHGKDWLATASNVMYNQTILY